MNTQTTPEAVKHPLLKKEYQQQPLTIVEPKATESFVVRKGSIKIAEFPHYLHDEPSKAESKKYAQMLVEAPSMKAEIELLKAKVARYENTQSVTPTDDAIKAKAEDMINHPFDYEWSLDNRNSFESGAIWVRDTMKTQIEELTRALSTMKAQRDSYQANANEIHNRVLAEKAELTRQRDEFKKSLIRLRDAVNTNATPDNLKAALMDAEYIIHHV